MRQKSKGRPGKSARPTSRFKAQGLAPKLHQNDLPKAKPSDVYFAAGGFYADHFGASSVASALPIRSGATPTEPYHPNIHFLSLTSKPDISTWHRVGHFYLALTAFA